MNRGTGRREMPKQNGQPKRGTSTPYSRGGRMSGRQSSSTDPSATRYPATRQRGRTSSQQTGRRGRGNSHATLTRQDIPALVQEVVQSLSRGGNPELVDSAADTSSQPVEPSAAGQTPTPSASRLRSGNSQVYSGADNGENSELPLTREDIPRLVQQVLQALPGALTSTSTLITMGDNPPAPQQNNSSSTEQDPPPPPSKLTCCACSYIQ